MDPTAIHLPLFTGQGTDILDASSTRRQAEVDSSTPSGQVLLGSLHQAFLSELRSLSKDDLRDSQIDLSDFRSSDSLLTQPHEGSYARNPIMSGSYLFLIQSLRYLRLVETAFSGAKTSSPFSDVLKSNGDHDVGVLGFSSGILIACVVASSSTTLSYLNRAVEVYRVVLRIGIRAQSYRLSSLNASNLSRDTQLPWSVVVSGLPLEEFKVALNDFSTEHPNHLVYLTAVIQDTCWTVSGRPDHLSLFIKYITQNHSVVTHATTLGSLYHCKHQGDGIRDCVLKDVRSRGLSFPDFSDLLAPIRSTIDGNLYKGHQDEGTLLEHVIDSILIHPVRWDLIQDRLSSLPVHSLEVRILNVGPGSGLVHSIRRIFRAPKTSVVDSNAPDETKVPNAKSHQEAIAIIGMAVNMPGASDVDELWEVLQGGAKTVSEIPETRFKLEEWRDRSSSRPSCKTRWGHFIDGADLFDNKFFRISPREAKNMDPQQRILLHTAYDALDDAGYVPNGSPTFNPETFACFIGAATSDYACNLSSDIDVHYTTGTLKAFLSGRISHAMQFGGPSMVVDTACSSSTVAIHQAVRSLMNGDCNAALVGGVNIITCPETFIGLDRGHFLSPTGTSKPFDASADGYVRGEGCGVFIFKRLADAIAENDRIWGVIRAVEANQSGLASSITHPHIESQINLLRRVLQTSGLQANDISVIEAHGTGTQAGDPAEIESLHSVFSQNRSSANPLYITSIKATIGHLEAASGVASLAKLLLMMKRKVIPRQIVDTLHPRIAPLAHDHFIMNFDQVPWNLPYPGSRRAALLSNYGAAGSNAALIVEEYIPLPRLSSDSELQQHVLFAISAKDSASLEVLRSNYLEWLGKHNELSLSDIAYCATARRRIYNNRIAVSTHSIEDLMGKLSTAPVSQVTVKQRQSAFVFSGQGSQYLGMGQSLYRTCQFFRQSIDYCNDVLVSAGFSGCLRFINPESDMPPLCLEDVEEHQTSLVALQYVLAKLWVSWGVEPDVVIGHSLGEYAALVIANVISIEDALVLTATRARLMSERCLAGATGMIVVQAPRQEIDAALNSGKFQQIAISCLNGPNDYVLSGPLAEIDALKLLFSNDSGVRTAVLNVPFGYHSRAMNPISTRLTKFSETVRLHPPTIPIVSTVLGRVVLPGDTDAFDVTYFTRHCCGPVRFDEGLRSLLSHPSLHSTNTWIDIGPHPQTISMMRTREDIGIDDILLCSLRRQEPAWKTLMTSLSHLYLSGLSLKCRSIFNHIHPNPSCIELPGYPYSKSSFWIPYQANVPSTSYSGSKPEHPMLHACKQEPRLDNAFTSVYETSLEDLKSFILGHTVGGVPLCPASVYLEQVLEALRDTLHLCPGSNGSTPVLRHIEFPNPLVYEPYLECLVTVTVVICGKTGTFSVTSGPEGVLHVKGDYHIRSIVDTEAKFVRMSSSLIERVSALLSHSDLHTKEVFYTRTIYEVIFPRVVRYSQDYRLIEKITVNPTNMEACAQVSYPTQLPHGYIIHPLFLDAIIHTAGFVANLRGAPNDAYICAEMGAIRFICRGLYPESTHNIYCSNVWVPDDGTIHIDVHVFVSEQQPVLVAHIKDMQFRQVRLDRLKRGLLSVSRSRSSSLSLSRSVHSISPHTSPSISSNPPHNSTGSTYDPNYVSSAINSFNENGPDGELKTNHRVGLLEILATVLEVQKDDLHNQADLTNLGLDSLSSIEVIQQIQANLNIEVPSNLFTFAKTIEELDIYFSGCKPEHPTTTSTNFLSDLDSKLRRFEETGDSQHPLSLLQAGRKENIPLFLIHDGSGTISHYSRLQSIDRQVWAIQSARVDSMGPVEDIDDMAERYYGLISARTSGSVIIGGWSFGGVVAYEVGLKLVQNGIHVAGIILIDTPGPENVTPLSMDFIRCILKNHFVDIDSDLARIVGEEFHRNSKMLTTHHFTQPHGDCPAIMFLRCEDAFRNSSTMNVPEWLVDRMNPRSIVKGWESITKASIPICDIAGNHFQAFDRSSIDRISSCIKETCLDFERHHGRTTV